MPDNHKENHLVILLECVLRLSTLLDFPVSAPDLSSSVMVILFCNFFTTGTNVKIKGFVGTPTETWGEKKEEIESGTHE